MLTNHDETIIACGSDVLSFAECQEKTQTTCVRRGRLNEGSV